MVTFMKEYAVYKGDEFIALGTLEELSKLLNVKMESLRWLSTPSAIKRSQNKRIEVYLIEDEKEQ
jgi:hypothetical protein